MKIAINKIHYPVTTLGYGKRIGIWTQGCTIHCPGCLSKDTWKSDDSHMIAIDLLVESLNEWLKNCDGVTISGGEPLDQYPSVIILLEKLRPLVCGDILLFTGYSYERVIESFQKVLDKVDLLITDPFIDNESRKKYLRGSDNQRVFALSPRAVEKYSLDINSMEWGEHRRMDLMSSGNEIWFAGIPDKEFLKKLKENLFQHGLECQTSDQILPVRP